MQKSSSMQVALTQGLRINPSVLKWCSFIILKHFSEKPCTPKIHIYIHTHTFRWNPRCILSFTFHLNDTTWMWDHWWCNIQAIYAMLRF